MADEPKNKEVQVSINLDTTPILYTDNVLMSLNDNGLVLDVAQTLGPSQSARIVSRIGMSRQHAEKLVQELGKLLAMTKGQKRTSSES